MKELKFKKMKFVTPLFKKSILDLTRFLYIPPLSLVFLVAIATSLKRSSSLGSRMTPDRALRSVLDPVT
jgi:hypothetical protein